MKRKVCRNNKYSNYKIQNFMVKTGIRFILGTLVVISLDSYINDKIRDKYKISEIPTITIENIAMEEELNKAHSYFQSQEYLDDLENGTVFISDISKPIEIEVNAISDEERYISKYCEVYGLDKEIIYNKIKELTNNFTSEEYINGYIPGITFKKEIAHSDSVEALMLMAVRCCKQIPNSVGLDNNIYVENNIKECNYIEQIKYYSDLLEVDANLVYAIMKSESNFDSDFANTTNNYSSLKNNDGTWMKFDNIEQNIIETCSELYKLNKDGKYTPEDIQPTYAPIEDDNEHWLSNVKTIYEETQMSGLLDSTNLVAKR